jgi:hypothetical protein
MSVGATDSILRQPYQGHLVPGRRYRVIKAFLDARKSVHRPGETWTFVGYSPRGPAETTVIYTRGDDTTEHAFGIVWNDATDNVLENLRDYIQQVEP